MRKSILAIIIAMATAFSLSGNSTASYLDGYNEITVYDGVSGPGDWQGVDEDHEVEPGAATGQMWDLEGFFQKGADMLMVGGYDFKYGQEGSGDSHIESGDIFIDTNGDGGDSSQGDYGYEYVLAMDFLSETYDVIQLDDNVDLTGVYTNFTFSNPWRYSSGGQQLLADVSFLYDTGLSDADVGFTGGLHNAVGFNLSFLDANSPFTLHFTQECGNDMLKGYGSAPIPEPATKILFGTGLLGLAGIGRKNLKRKSA